MALAPERLSRFLTFLLRHKPKDYPLAIDREGFAPLPEVVDMVQERFYDVNEEQIRSLIAGAEKKRFEIRGEKVRATYGHSFPIDLGATAPEPPAELYFAAARDLAESMLRDGLTPRDRQYVHLTAPPTRPSRWRAGMIRRRRYLLLQHKPPMPKGFASMSPGRCSWSSTCRRNFYRCAESLFTSLIEVLSKDELYGSCTSSFISLNGRSADSMQS